MSEIYRIGKMIEETERAIHAAAPIQAYLENKHGRRIGLREAWGIWCDEAYERLQIRRQKILIARKMALMNVDVGSLDAATLDLYRLSPSDVYQPILESFKNLYRKT